MLPFIIVEVFQTEPVITKSANIRTLICIKSGHATTIVRKFLQQKHRNVYNPFMLSIKQRNSEKSQG